MNKIYWLASYPKSGNTWIRALLCSYQAEEQGPINLNDLPYWSADSRVLFDREMGIESSNLLPKELDNYRPDAYRQLAQRIEDFDLLKVHDAYRLNDKGEPIFPTDVSGGIIYIVRNPLDVCISFAHHSTQPIQTIINCMGNEQFSLASAQNGLRTQLPQLLGSWSSHVESWLGVSKIPKLVIKYEALL